jgi:hypothetical protein
VAVDAPKKVQRGPRFLESMPRPLMATFLVVAAGTLVLVILLMLAPPRSPTVVIAARRPAPRGTLSHDVGRLVAAPVPTTPPTFRPPCEAFRTTRVEGGPPGVARFRAALGRLCPFFAGGVPRELAIALRGFERATIRFAAFARTGVESTSDLGARRIWVNVRFARTGSPYAWVSPVLVHEAWHLANGGSAVTAEQELDARAAELTTCRFLMDPDRWPRGCRDAEVLLALPRSRAVELLRSAGYAGEKR